MAEPTFEELVADVNAPEAKEVIKQINFSDTTDPDGGLDEFARLERLAIEETPKPPDDNENRYGVSLVFDIYVAKKNSNNNYGRFGQFDFLPRLALIPFYNTVFDIPAEMRGSTVVGESIDEVLAMQSGDFDYDAMKSGIQGGFNKIRKTAKQLAELFESDHRAHGAGILAPLQNFTYEQAKKIYLACLPYQDKKLFIELFGEARCNPRTVLGMRLDDSPFLDVLTDYLTYKAADRIDDSALLSIEKDKAHEVLEFLLTFAETGTIHATQRIQEKEEEIKEGNKTRGYDRPNRLVVGAPKPPDIVRLAHLNRVPMDERNLSDIKAMGEAIANNMQGNGGFNPFPAPNAQVSNLPGNMSMDEIINAAAQKLMHDPNFIASVEKGVLEKAGLQ